MNRDEFIEENLGLVHSCAKRFRGKGIEYDDLYSAGCIGLVKVGADGDKLVVTTDKNSVDLAKA